MENSPLYYNPQLAPTERAHLRHTGLGDCAQKQTKKAVSNSAYKGWTTYDFLDNSPSKVTILQFSPSEVLSGFPGGAVVKNSPAKAGDDRDMGSTPGAGRSPGAGNGNPLQYSCLENFTDRGAW